MRARRASIRPHRVSRVGEAVVVESVPELLTMLELEDLGSDTWQGAAPRTTMQRLFGGTVLSQSLIAAAGSVEPERLPHSLHGYFHSPGSPGAPLVYRVERVRDGRSFSLRRVVADQSGSTIFTMTASFQEPEEGLDHQDDMPATAPPRGLDSHEDRLRRSGSSRVPDGVRSPRHPVCRRRDTDPSGDLDALLGPPSRQSAGPHGRPGLRLRPDAARDRDDVRTSRSTIRAGS